MKKINFQDKEWILIGEKDGAITTEEAYKHGLVSYAHLYSNGAIMRFDKQIGTIEDIIFLKDIDDIEPDEDAFDNIFGDSWFGI